MGKKEKRLIALPANTAAKVHEVYVARWNRESSNNKNSRQKPSWNGDLDKQSTIMAAIRKKIASINHQLQQQPPAQTAQQTPEQQSSLSHGSLVTPPSGLQPPLPGQHPTASSSQQPTSAGAQPSAGQQSTSSSISQPTPQIQPPTFILPQPQPNQSQTQPTTTQQPTSSSETKSLQAPFESSNSDPPAQQTLSNSVVSQTIAQSQSQSKSSATTSAAKSTQDNPTPSTIYVYTASGGISPTLGGYPNHDLGGIGQIGVFPESGSSSLDDNQVAPLVLLLLVIFSHYIIHRH